MQITQRCNLFARCLVLTVLLAVQALAANSVFVERAFEGLDQLNIGPLPRSLAGKGEVDIVVTIDGKQANVVTIATQ